MPPHVAEAEANKAIDEVFRHIEFSEEITIDFKHSRSITQAAARYIVKNINNMGTVAIRDAGNIIEKMISLEAKKLYEERNSDDK